VDWWGDGVGCTDTVQAARLPAVGLVIRCARFPVEASQQRRPDTDGIITTTKENDMANDSLTAFIAGIRPAWGPLTSDLVARTRSALEQLVAAPPTEEWLAALLRKAPASEELYRDPAHGFVLLAHSEPAGLYRPPHDHGRSWVVYILQQGEIEMGSYARVQDADGRIRLVQRDATVLRPGHAMAYLPGDIHDTRCLAGPALLLRFAERDLKREDQEEHRVTRYVERDGGWTVGGACALGGKRPGAPATHG
jgi:hypothetical protein